jgi:hypothetical protein
MRKLLFLFVVTMLSVTAMAQDVIYDKTNDGEYVPWFVQVWTWEYQME